MTKSLAKAIALATVLGASASAHAVNINPDGLGEVLLYSLYTAEEGNVTEINITNTSDFAKAVKVRFVEGQNSQDVLDFNLYLSPRDQWTGLVTTSENGEGARLITRDTSCTAPAIPAAGVNFRDLEYTKSTYNGVEKDNRDGGNETLARTRVGHLEVIEMGTLYDIEDIGLPIPGVPPLFEGLKMASAVTHDHTKSGAAGTTPADCGAVINAFKNDTAGWGTKANRDTAAYDKAMQKNVKVNNKARNSLYGHATVLNNANATRMSYDAVAVANFLVGDEDFRRVDRDGTIHGNFSIHVKTGDTEPGLNSSKATSAKTAQFSDGSQVTFDQPVQAITALLSKENISNDYVIDTGRASQTDWVVTFPTKRFHVDAGFEYSTWNGTHWEFTNNAAGLAPFAEKWNTAKGEACNDITISYWDSEEYTKPEADVEIDFSPSRPGHEKKPTLCYQTNIITFNDGSVLGGELLKQNLDFAQPDFRYGWMNVAFDGVSTGVSTGVQQNGTVNGLPVIGFSATIMKNNFATPGVNNNYGSLIDHKSVVNVKSVR